MAPWWLCIPRNGEARKFDILSQIWTWRSRPIASQNNRDLNQGICTSGPNLVILAWIDDELLCGQAQNGVNFDFEVKFDLEFQGQSPPKTLGILTKVLYNYGPNLVTLALTGDELSRGQAWLPDTKTQATTILGSMVSH